MLCLFLSLFLLLCKYNIWDSSFTMLTNPVSSLCRVSSPLPLPLPLLLSLSPFLFYPPLPCLLPSPSPPKADPRDASVTDGFLRTE